MVGLREADSIGPFALTLLRGETIQIFNFGSCRRDFTYVVLVSVMAGRRIV